MFDENLVVVYGSKPRKTKGTSYYDTINGFELYFHCTKGETGEHIVMYYGMPPYPRLRVFPPGSQRGTFEKWIDANRKQLILRLKQVKNKIQIPKEMMKDQFKQIKANPNGYVIYESKVRDYLVLITPFINGEHIYLYVDPLTCPMKTTYKKKSIDVEKIAEEYQRRKGEE